MLFVQVQDRCSTPLKISSDWGAKLVIGIYLYVIEPGKEERSILAPQGLLQSELVLVVGLL